MKRIFAAFLLTGFLSIALFAQTYSPDLILFNGKIFTSNLTNPSAEAIAIRGERILAIGANADIKRLASETTQLIDLQNHVVVPGFNDAHNHFAPQPSGVYLEFPTMEPTLADTIEAIKKAAMIAPKGQWIFGTIGGDVMSDSQANRKTLDQISPNNPVFLETYYGHGQIINSKAMLKLKIGENPTNPVGGNFERDARTKTFNGRIFEYAQWRQSRVLAEQVSDKEAIEALKTMADEAIRLGITSIQLMPTMRIERFVRLLRASNLPLRIRAIPFSLTTAVGRDLSEIQSLHSFKLQNPKISVTGIKWILDGTPFERGAAVRQPYRDDPTTRGKLNFAKSGVRKMLLESLKYNQQILFHCAGDRSAELVLSSMENLKNINWKQKRVRIEHGDGLTPDLILRAKKLGVIIVQNPTHLSLVEMVNKRYSPTSEFFAVRSLVDAGIPFAFGADGPMNPYLNLMLAAIHPSRPKEAISVEQGVRAYTVDSAFSEFSDADKGTLTKGKYADLTVLSQDIFNVPILELPKTTSILTLVGGKIAFDAKTFK